MVFGWKNDGLALGSEKEGGDGVIEPELVDERMYHPISNSELEIEVEIKFIRHLIWE